MDANTLAEAAVVEGDPQRFNAAKRAAKKMAKDKMKEAKAIEEVARAKKKG